jgi:general secretion pathway protein G
MKQRAFTLIELLVVLAVMASLLTLVAPRYFGSLDRGKENVLKENLAGLRDSLDKFYADTGRYPDRLEDLVSKGYLRKVPIDPLTDSSKTWKLLPPADTSQGGVADVRSSASGTSLDGSRYADW